MPKIDLKAILVCPECGTKQTAIMPVENKQHFYKCANEQCGANIATKENDCCVFCSHSNKLCPAKQLEPKLKEESKLRSLI
ncbi:MAG: hypothetical protein H6772_01135 [Pseudomonadales bacterium]|nr:hypothetical protein [Pseudomonadales bacterium]